MVARQWDRWCLVAVEKGGGVEFFRALLDHTLNVMRMPLLPSPKDIWLTYFFSLVLVKASPSTSSTSASGAILYWSCRQFSASTKYMRKWSGRE